MEPSSVAEKMESTIEKARTWAGDEELEKWDDFRVQVVARDVLRDAPPYHQMR